MLRSGPSATLFCFVMVRVRFLEEARFDANRILSSSCPSPIQGVMGEHLHQRGEVELAEALALRLSQNVLHSVLKHEVCAERSGNGVYGLMRAQPCVDRSLSVGCTAIADRLDQAVLLTGEEGVGLLDVTHEDIE